MDSFGRSSRIWCSLQLQGEIWITRWLHQLGQMVKGLKGDERKKFLREMFFGLKFRLKSVVRLLFSS